MTSKKDSLRAALKARDLYYSQANAPTDGSPTPSVPRMPSLEAVASKMRHQAGILESGRSKGGRIGSGRERAPVRAVRASPGPRPRAHGHIADGGGPEYRLRTHNGRLVA
jgi:hypothetical protein